MHWRDESVHLVVHLVIIFVTSTVWVQGQGIDKVDDKVYDKDSRGCGDNMVWDIISRIVSETLKIAVLISGGGRTMVNLAEHIAAEALPARIARVISSKADSLGVGRADEAGLGTCVVDRHAYQEVAVFSRNIFDRAREVGADLVCMAGWLWLLEIPDDFVHRVINIHPALLPSFGGKGLYGHHVHEAVLAAGCKISGCTVHFADQTYDTGPIIVQRACAVHEDDTAESLAARVFAQECIAYPQAVRLIAEGRVKVVGRRARIEE